MKNKGIVFTLDALIALFFVAILSLVFFLNISYDFKSFEKIILTNQISDLLITSQLLEIEQINELEANYIKLFENKKGYLIINNQKKEINSKNSQKHKILSQNIRYINSSNKEIYIEIGVYY